MHVEVVFVALFALATAVAIIARRFRIPYTAALVVAGLAVGAMNVIEPPHLTKELLFALFLPGLLFEAAFHIEFKDFNANKITIVSLAVPGVIAAILLTALVLTPTTNALHFVDDFQFIHGLVLAALLAATDPIAVVGLFKSLGTPKRLATLIEGESLLNDGTAVVIFTLIMAVALGGEFSFGGAVVDFLRVAGIGSIVGLAFGAIVSWATHRIEDPMVEITLTTIAAYGSFVVAEQFHFSGVIATVVAGIMCGNYGARTGMSPTTRISVESFWEYTAFALNSLVFLLIGFEVSVGGLLRSWKPIVVAFLAVFIVRSFVVFGVSGLLRLTRERIPWSWSAVLTWGGLRGGLSMVLVLTLARDFPNRDLLVTTTFGVVILSILFNGMTMGPLLRFFGLGKKNEYRQEYERHRAELRAARAALAELEDMVQTGDIRPGLQEQLQAEYEVRTKESIAAIKKLHRRQSDLVEEEALSTKRHLILVEKEALIQASRQGFIGKEGFEQTIADLDARLLEIEEDNPQASSH